MGVKLYLYQYHGQNIMIDTYTAKSYDDFVIVSIPTALSHGVEQVQTAISQIIQDKKILLVDESLFNDIEFYGLREEDSSSDFDSV